MPVSGIKDKLMGALHSAVANFNEDGDPNSAVTKAAQAHEFNPDQTARLVEMFNSARTIYHYKTAQDRTNTFALADPNVVIPQYYEEPEKKAAAASGLHPTYLDYDRPEVDYRDNMLVKEGGAHNDIVFEEPTDHRDMSLDTMGKRAHDLIAMQKDLAEHARHEAGAAGTKAGLILSKLAQDLATGYEEVCIERWQKLAAAHLHSGSEDAPVIRKLAEFLPAWLQATVDITKVAEELVDDRDLEAEEAQIKEARFWMEAEAQMLAYSDTMSKEAGDFHADFTALIVNEFPAQREANLSDFLYKVGATTVTTSRKETGVQPLFGFGKGEPFDRDTKSVSEPVVGKAISDAVGEGVKKPLSEGVASGVDAMLTGPTERNNVALSDRLRNVQRQVMLEDLMMNDPVLADEDPDIVANAYSTILRIAPEVAGHKEVVRAILRTSVHAAGIGPYDAKDYADLEKELLTITGRMPARPEARGQGRGGR
jgi:hypothetical protein